MKLSRAARLAALAALCLGALAGCKGSESHAPQGGRPPRPVVLSRVEAPAEGLIRSYSGVARAALETKLSFRVPGQIIELKAKVGREVKPGELIARLDPTDFGLRAKQLTAELARVAAGLKAAANDYARVRSLYEVGNATASDLDSARANHESRQAQHEAVARDLELAKKQLDYTVLTAPLAGAIAQVPVEVHQTVAAGAVIATLSTDQRLEVETGVPETFVGLLKRDEPAEVAFDAWPGFKFPARVTEVGVQVGASTTYPVKLALSSADSRVRPGMVGEVTFSLASPSARTYPVAPPEAVFGAPDGRRLAWVYDPADQTVHARELAIGELTSRGLEIKSGLKPGELVVTRGIHHLAEGQKTRPFEARPR